MNDPLPPATSKRSSLSTRASKIPQKLAQSTFFSLKPSSSSLVSSSTTSSSNSTGNDRLSTRISQILFSRQRTTSESIIKDSRSTAATQSLDLGDSSTRYLSRSLDIINDEIDTTYNNNNTTTAGLLNNNQTSSSSSPSAPYSISSPERTDFYSYYNANSKEEFNLFSPLSFSNSSVSSFADSIFHITPPSSPMLPSIISPPNNNNNNNNSSSSSSAATATYTQHYADSLVERCTHLLDSIASTDSNDMHFSHVREMESLSNGTIALIDACEEPYCAQETTELRHQMSQIQKDLYITSLEGLSTTKSLLIDIQTICKKCLTLLSESPSLCFQPLDGFKKETPHMNWRKMTAKDYHDLPSDQIDANASWFRHHFVGKPYYTFIGDLKVEKPANLPLIDLSKKSDPKKKKNSSSSSNNNTNKRSLTRSRNSKSLLNTFLSSNDTEEISANDSIGIISVIQERAKDFGGPGNGAASILGSQYRIIIRGKEHDHSRFVVHECMVKETQSQLKAKGESHKLDKNVVSHQDKRLRQFMSRNTGVHTMPSLTESETNNSMSRMLRAAILSVCPGIDLRSFKELSAESTIMAGLEKALLSYDEIHVPKHYKFGILNVRDNQTTEESWFSNTGLSGDLQDFLNIIGDKVKLKDYKGYAAGLDTKTGESGQFTYVSKWSDIDITYHVAPLMPSQKNDRQHILRKKHIGNDIVSIVFLESNDQTFNPKAIRSQFLHIYIVVRPEHHDDKRYWRVEVISKSNVGDFGPALPSPPIFDDDETLREFLTLKLVNAENAALKSDKFFIPNRKAKLSLLSTHVETGLAFNIPKVVRSSSTNRLASNKSSSYLSTKMQQQQKQQQQKKTERPKSVSNKSPVSSIGSNGSSRLLREALLDEEKRNRTTMASTDIPPIPTTSRSTLLQDLKKGFVSSSKKIKGERKITRKTSRLQISSTLSTHLEKAAETNQQSNSSSSSSADHYQQQRYSPDSMFVGRDINISSESFISTEQLFASASHDKKLSPAASSASSVSSASSSHYFSPKPSPSKTKTKTIRSPTSYILSNTTATTATSINDSHIPSLSWQ